jgi:hypothetical protein
MPMSSKASTPLIAFVIIPDRSSPPLSPCTPPCAQVEFIKNVGLLKGAIQSGTVGATKKLMVEWVSVGWDGNHP